MEQALSHVFGYGVESVSTRRDLQAQAKEKGKPWEMSKWARSKRPDKLDSSCTALRASAQ